KDLTLVVNRTREVAVATLKSGGTAVAPLDPGLNEVCLVADNSLSIDLFGNTVCETVAYLPQSPD
ncbi:MAG: hypothetical protein KJO07_06635, partial [Deltaproteobacteria bacterium]|nr:hypothetical protein [Deltaproteobacteria bacterium]